MLGFSVDDAAAILATSPGTIKSRCARGRARLLPYLAHLRAGPLGPGGGGPPPGDREAPGGGSPGLAPQGNRSVGESVSPAQGGDA